MTNMTTNSEEDYPLWDEYAHVYIMGVNDKANHQKSEFTNPLLTRIYNYGRGVGNPPAFESYKPSTP